MRDLAARTRYVACQLYLAKGREASAEENWLDAEDLLQKIPNDGTRCLTVRLRTGKFAIVEISPGHSSYDPGHEPFELLSTRKSLQKA